MPCHKDRLACHDNLARDSYVDVCPEIVPGLRIYLCGPWIDLVGLTDNNPRLSYRVFFLSDDCRDLDDSAGRQQCARAYGDGCLLPLCFASDCAASYREGHLFGLDPVEHRRLCGFVLRSGDFLQAMVSESP